MKKLPLELDALAVETFDPAPAQAAEKRGTVEGNQIVAPPTRYFTCQQTCAGNLTCGGDTCGATCGQETCFQSCYGTCGVTQCMYC
jgi:hypothetical protein